MISGVKVFASLCKGQVEQTRFFSLRDDLVIKYMYLYISGIKYSLSHVVIYSFRHSLIYFINKHTCVSAKKIPNIMAIYKNLRPFLVHKLFCVHGEN